MEGGGQKELWEGKERDDWNRGMEKIQNGDKEGLNLKGKDERCERGQEWRNKVRRKKKKKMMKKKKKKKKQKKNKKKQKNKKNKKKTEA